MEKGKIYRDRMEIATSGFILIMAIAVFSGNRAAIGISSFAVGVSCVASLVLYKKWRYHGAIERPFLAKVMSWAAIGILVLDLLLEI